MGILIFGSAKIDRHDTATDMSILRLLIVDCCKLPMSFGIFRTTEYCNGSALVAWRITSATAQDTHFEIRVLATSLLSSFLLLVAQ